MVRVLESCPDGDVDEGAVSNHSILPHGGYRRVHHLGDHSALRGNQSCHDNVLTDTPPEKIGVREATRAVKIMY